MSEQTMLTLDEVRSADDVKELVLDVPEWGGSVRLRGTNVEDGMRMLDQMMGPDGKPDNEKAILNAVINGVIEPKFTADDIAWLKKKSLKALTRIAEAFNTLNGFTAADLASAKNA